MLFNSYAFILLFMPVVVGVYFGLGRWSNIAGHYWLIVASLFFYGWWNPVYLWLIVFSLSVNFSIGKYLLAGRQSKGRLGLGIAFNLLLLGYYKYTDFFLENVNALLGTDYNLLHIILPLGISFFTFTQIAYLVETYRGVVIEHNFRSYILFVTYFPHLLAGPIIHYEQMMPQFMDKALKKVNYENLSRGLFLFGIGLVKKVMIADTLGKWADAGYASVGQVDLSTLAAWTISLAYTFQLYFDFSGYTDMALGISLMLNIKLPINFDSPYKSASIIEFWRRWHITLSFFLRDYLYIPLGGNRKGKLRKYLNILTTMFLGGLWHGAGWTYVLWGGTHGLGIVINHVFRERGGKMPRWLGLCLTFLFVNFAWVLFRAESVAQALTLYSSMLHIGSWQSMVQGGLPALPDGRREIIAEILLFLLVVFVPNSIEISRSMKNTYKWAVAAGMLLALGVLALNRDTAFLYYQF